MRIKHKLLDIELIAVPHGFDDTKMSVILLDSQDQILSIILSREEMLELGQTITQILRNNEK